MKQIILLLVKDYLGHSSFGRENGWIFPHSWFYEEDQPCPEGRQYCSGDADAIGRKGDVEGMIRNKVIGLTAVFALLLLIAVPVTAAETTILLNIPGAPH